MSPEVNFHRTMIKVQKARPFSQNEIIKRSCFLTLFLGFAFAPHWGRRLVSQATCVSGQCMRPNKAVNENVH